MSKVHFALVGLAVSVALLSCDDVELAPIAPATPESLARSLGPSEMFYVGDDTFNGNPQALLGQVIILRGQDGACPNRAKDGPAPKFSLEPLRDFKVDERSILGSPVKRDSQIITHDGAAGVTVLSYLSASLDAKTIYSMILFDQASARVDDKDITWRDASDAWIARHTELFEEKDLCKVLVVKGFVQNNIILRKFTELSAAAKGGAYGVNVNGKYHTSTDDYTVDIRYGLSVATMWQPGMSAFALPVGPVQPSAEELEFLSTITTIAHEKR